MEQKIKNLLTFEQLQFALYLQIDIELDLHLTGDCADDCYLCKEQYELECSWEVDDLLIEHEKTHKNSWEYPNINQRYCEYCRMDYVILREIGTKKKLKENS